MTQDTLRPTKEARLGEPQSKHCNNLGDRTKNKSLILYQVYISSFHDSNGDGIGDLSGIVSKLDYIKNLGVVDGIWVTPFYLSPWNDGGYDVADHCRIDPRFGTMDDFKKLIAEAHSRKLLICIDQVYPHTSDTHPWFIESASSDQSPKADFYIWHQGKKDGSEPNNWRSVTTGRSAWVWDLQRKEYYLAHFHPSQPALNLHNTKVQEELLKICKFWLDLGVDGLRLDAVPFLMHDPALRNNPPRNQDDPLPDGFSSDFPYARQRQLYNFCYADIPSFLRRLRVMSNEYQDSPRFLLGEVVGEDSLRLAATYIDDGKLHMAYHFGLLKKVKTPEELVKLMVRNLEAVEKLGTKNLCWSSSNHDVERVVSRWGSFVLPQERDRVAKVIMALHLSLPGHIIIYQGEELGLPQADLTFDQLKDPYDISLYPNHIGRDGARTSFPWQAEAPNFGFSSVQPWISLTEINQAYREHQSRAVDRQDGVVGSVLEAYRSFLRFRRHHPALKEGSFSLVKEIKEPALLAFLRRHEKEQLLLVYNFGAERVFFPLDSDEYFPLEERELMDIGFRWEPTHQGVLLYPYSFFIAEKG